MYPNLKSVPTNASCLLQNLWKRMIKVRLCKPFVSCNGKFINWRASEASETLSGVTNGNRRYIYVYIFGMCETTLCYVKWAELSASHF